MVRVILHYAGAALFIPRAGVLHLPHWQKWQVVQPAAPYFLNDQKVGKESHRGGSS